MAILCVRNGSTSTVSPAGGTIVLDFSDSTTNGQQILSFAVGLSGYVLDYNAIDTADYAEPLAQLGVSLVPQLIDNKVVVMASVLMCDGDGDAAGNPDEDGEPPTQVFVTAVALVGNPNDVDSTDVLGNVFGVQTGGALPTISQQNSVQVAGLAGFYMVDAGTGNGEISSFNLGVTTTSSGGLTGSVSCNVGSEATSATVDAFMMSASPSLGCVSETTSTYVSYYEPRGKAVNVQAIFTVPSNYTLNTEKVGIILQKSALQYDSGSHEFMIIDCFPYATSITNVGQTYTVTWTFNVNIYNPDWFVSGSYLDGYNISAVAFAECVSTT